MAHIERIGRYLDICSNSVAPFIALDLSPSIFTLMSQILTRLEVHSSKPRVFILSDILNEPNNSEPLVRLLLYSDEMPIRSLVVMLGVCLPWKLHVKMSETGMKSGLGMSAWE